MKKLTILFFATFVFNQLFGQAEPSSVYGDLPTKKFYGVSTSRSGNVYWIDGVKVEKAVYDKYHAAWEEFGNCCPCILLTYDKDDVLLTEAVQCTDCFVGYYKEFYPNGRLKLQGHYKENPTDDWKGIYEKGYCNVKDGKWIYYDENGQVIKVETWKDGDFVEQKPIGNKPEIWRVEKWVNDEIWKGGTINIDDLGAFEIVLRYKNEHRFQAINAILSIGFIGKKTQEYEMPMNELNADKLVEIAQSFEHGNNKMLSAKISIHGDGELIQKIHLSLDINK
jgi:hypothetical protein